MEDLRKSDFEEMIDYYVEELQGLECPFCIKELVLEIHKDGYMSALENQRDMLNEVIDELYEEDEIEE